MTAAYVDLRHRMRNWLTRQLVHEPVEFVLNHCELLVIWLMRQSASLKRTEVAGLRLPTPNRNPWYQVRKGRIHTVKDSCICTQAIN